MIELPFKIGKKTKWISGITETTTCKDIVLSILQSELLDPGDLKDAHRHFALVEKWREVEKVLRPSTLVLKIWSAWGAEAENVTFLVKRVRYKENKESKEINQQKQDGIEYTSSTVSKIRRRNSRNSGKGQRPSDTFHPRSLVRSPKDLENDIQGILASIIHQGEAVKQHLMQIQTGEEHSKLEKLLNDIRILSETRLPSPKPPIAENPETSNDSGVGGEDVLDLEVKVGRRTGGRIDTPEICSLDSSLEYPLNPITGEMKVSPYSNSTLEIPGRGVSTQSIINHNQDVKINAGFINDRQNPGSSFSGSTQPLPGDLDKDQRNLSNQRQALKSQFQDLPINNNSSQTYQPPVLLNKPNNRPEVPIKRLPAIPAKPEGTSKGRILPALPTKPSSLVKSVNESEQFRSDLGTRMLDTKIPSVGTDNRKVNDLTNCSKYPRVTTGQQNIPEQAKDKDSTREILGLNMDPKNAKRPITNILDAQAPKMSAKNVQGLTDINFKKEGFEGENINISNEGLDGLDEDQDEVEDDHVLLVPPPTDPDFYSWIEMYEKLHRLNCILESKEEQMISLSYHCASLQPNQDPEQGYKTPPPCFNTDVVKYREINARLMQEISENGSTLSRLKVWGEHKRKLVSQLEFDVNIVEREGKRLESDLNIVKSLKICEGGEGGEGGESKETKTIKSVRFSDSDSSLDPEQRARTSPRTINSVPKSILKSETSDDCSSDTGLSSLSVSSEEGTYSLTTLV